MQFVIKNFKKSILKNTHPSGYCYCMGMVGMVVIQIVTAMQDMIPVGILLFAVFDLDFLGCCIFLNVFL